LAVAAVAALGGTVACAATGILADGELFAIAGGFYAVLAGFALVHGAGGDVRDARRRRRTSRASTRVIDFTEADLLADVGPHARPHFGDLVEFVGTIASARADDRGWPDLREASHAPQSSPASPMLAAEAERSTG
jgi:hypothetical protein